MLYLFFQSLVLLFRTFVLLPQFLSVHVSSPAQHSLQVVDGIRWFLGLLIQLYENFGQLVHCTCALQVLLKLLLLSLDSSLRLTTNYL